MAEWYGHEHSLIARHSWVTRVPWYWLVGHSLIGLRGYWVLRVLLWILLRCGSDQGVGSSSHLRVWIGSAPAQTAAGEETAPEDNAEYNVE